MPHWTPPATAPPRSSGCRGSPPTSPAPDAVVTNAFLQAGAASPTALQQFDGFVADASKAIAEASRAEPGDAPALAEVNSSLTRYAASIASANANNRLGNEVGSAYLRQASQLLRTPSNDYAAMLPTLQSVADTDAARVDDAFGDAQTSLFVLIAAGLVVLGTLLAVQIWLDRADPAHLQRADDRGHRHRPRRAPRRRLAMLSSQTTADTVKDTHYAATKALAQARIAAYDAKANESLTLVYRGTGQAYEATWKSQYTSATDNLAAARNAGVTDTGSSALAAWGRSTPRSASPTTTASGTTPSGWPPRTWAAAARGPSAGSRRPPRRRFPVRPGP